ncbi:MAG: hypothetical protein J0L93_04540 [Deltaproteobacteria bacterium]|nr:hypothetical protein [Deltaproteobacteria bacterium]
MKNILTRCVNARRQKNILRNLILSIFSFGFFFSAHLIADEKNTLSLGRSIQFLELPQTLLNFKSDKEKYIWLTSEDQWKSFWKDYSRVDGKAPKLNVNWSTQSLLAIVWESKDTVVRIPVYQGIEEDQEGTKKSLRLIFSLQKPCFGIITDASPAKFLLVDQNFSDIDEVSMRTEESKAVGCF